MDFNVEVSARGNPLPGSIRSVENQEFRDYAGKSSSMGTTMSRRKLGEGSFADSLWNASCSVCNKKGAIHMTP